MNLKRKAVILLCTLLIIVSGAVPKAFADWYDDIESGYSVEIVGQNFVASTFWGVKAYYNETGNSVYHCGELVERFYREVYGLDVEIRSTEPRLRINNEGYKIVTTKTAKPGDVVFVSAAMRGTYDHWAIVKSVEDGYLVLFEQNVVYNGSAGVDRRLKYPSDSYIIFTVVTDDGKPAPTPGTQGVASQTTTSATEKQTEPTTKEETTTKVTTTAKPTTTKAVTTTKVTTTAKPVTTKATTVATTKPTTAKAVTTKATTKPATTLAETTTAAATTVESTTAPFVIYTAETKTETAFYSSVSYTEEKTEEKKSNKATVPLASACGVSASGVAVLAVLIKKKSEE
ncbi:MAG: CHAP domain-containing protein [Clostridia bacterium]|nr:CHAP domain-containing protein [Clostridia bacterium]